MVLLVDILFKFLFLFSKPKYQYIFYTIPIGRPAWKAISRKKSEWKNRIKTVCEISDKLCKYPLMVERSFCSVCFTTITLCPTKFLILILFFYISRTKNDNLLWTAFRYAYPDVYLSSKANPWTVKNSTFIEIEVFFLLHSYSAKCELTDDFRSFCSNQHINEFPFSTNMNNL